MPSTREGDRPTPVPGLRESHRRAGKKSGKDGGWRPGESREMLMLPGMFDTLTYKTLDYTHLTDEEWRHKATS